MRRESSSAGKSSHHTSRHSRGTGSITYGIRTIVDKDPRFQSIPKTFRVPESEKVILPCYTENLGDHKIVWRKGNEVLSAGPLLLSRDGRFHLHQSDFRLELRDITPSDAGDFTCQISIASRETIELSHTVEVLVPPRVRSKPADGKIVIKKGVEVMLECIASGNPVPKVTWTRENDNLLPAGSISGANQHGYKIHRVDRFDAGRYTCRADNGVGSPATAQIDLQVLYEPEIEVEAEKVHSGVGKEAHLTCIVHGEPRPSVRWFKESTELKSSPLGGRVRIESKESTHRHTLVLRELSSRNDFGNYSCVAENTLGVSKRHIEVHGRPTPAVFRNKPHQGGKNSFRLIWTVDSYSRIEEYRLLYRQIKPFHPDDVHGNVLGGNKNTGGSDWTNVIIPGDPSLSKSSLNSEFHHENAFLLKDLVADAQYECLVQAKNAYGWSEASRIHRFYTHSNNNYAAPARDLGWTTGGGSSSGKSGLPGKIAVAQFLLVTLVNYLGRSVTSLWQP